MSIQVENIDPYQKLLVDESDRSTDPLIAYPIGRGCKTKIVMPVIVAKQYVGQRDGGFWIIGSRISLDLVVYAFKSGLSPESIVQSFPLLTLEQVYGAIAFYLANRTESDAYLTQEEAEFDAIPQPLQTDSPLLYQKLIDAKAQRRKLVT